MKTLSLVLLLLLSKGALACDICGGVHANSSIGIFAANRFHTLGLSSQFRSYQSFEGTQLHSNEDFLLSNLQFRFQLGEKFQCYGNIPYQLGIQHIQGENSYRKNGIGDAQILFNTVLLQQKDSLGITQRFFSLAAGIKTPTGYTVSPSNLHQNLYPGTGSWDYPILVNGFFRFSSFIGLQNELSYIFKGKNKYAFKYGNSSQFSSMLVFNKKMGTYRYIGALGLQLDHFAKNQWDLETLTPESQHQGLLLQSEASIHILTYRWLYSLNCNLPMWQNVSNGNLRFGPQIQLSVQFLIQQKK